MACDKGHLLRVRCVDCVARELSTKSLELVELWWEHGIIEMDARDAYRHVWAISATRSATYDHWKTLPETEKSRAYARALVALLPSGRGYA